MFSSLFYFSTPILSVIHPIATAYIFPKSYLNLNVYVSEGTHLYIYIIYPLTSDIS